MGKKIESKDEMQINHLKRALHIIAIYQTSSKNKRLANSDKDLADLLSQDGDEILSENHIRIARHKIKLLLSENSVGDDLKGLKDVGLATVISPEQEQLLTDLYFPFVVNDVARLQCIKRLQNKFPNQVLSILATLHFAIQTGQKLQFNYCNFKNEKKEHLVNPLCLNFNKGKLYLYAEEQTSSKFFLVSKMAEIKILKQTFDKPENFEPENLYAHSFGAYVNEEESLDYLLKVDSSLKDILADAFIHLQPKIEEKDGFCFFKFRACDLAEVCRYLFFYGDRVEILEPLAARNYMKEQIALLQKIY